MVITVDEYIKITDYIRAVAGGTHLNVERVKVCQWIVEKVADGTITVEEA